MGGLIFAMLGLGQIDTGEFVHKQLAVIDFETNAWRNIRLLAIQRFERLIIFL
jgi:hypothetical protein